MDPGTVGHFTGRRGENARREQRLPHEHAEAKPSDENTRSTPVSLAARTRAYLVAHPAVSIALGVALILVSIGGTVWWLEARKYESTDDAFIDARTVSISSQINGGIVDVSVTDNQFVEPGSVLFRIDDRDYRATADQVNAQIEQARGNIANLDAQLQEQQARIEQAQEQASQSEAALTFAKQENTRAQELLTRGAGTQQQAQQTASNLRQAQAAYEAAQANLAVAQKQVAVLTTQRQVAEGQLQQAEAAAEQATANLPAAGRVTKLAAAKGDYAQVGQTLMMFVPREIWITANFKETQLTYMHAGEPVEIRIDAYPGRSFHGHVDSIQAGSGAAFSLLPPENATGNYVKVVQRIPVKILFNEPPDVYLGPGMSVVPNVKVR